MGLRIRHSARTDLGQKRTLNEDSFAALPDHNLFLVADGMGGHAAGEVASALAIETVDQFFSHTKQSEDDTWPFEIDEDLPLEANKLKTAIRLANRRIYQSALKTHRLEGMGTTLVGVVILEKEGLACVGHVGDSRAYLIRDGELWSLTVDHSWVNVQVMLGQITEEEAKYHPMKNIITRALGTKEDVDVDITLRELYPGDFLLLCSDGLSGMIDDKDILECVLEPRRDIHEMTETLINQANANGGDDNISVVLLQFVGEDPHEASTIRIDGPLLTKKPGGEDSSSLPTVKLQRPPKPASALPALDLQDPADDWQEDLEEEIEPIQPVGEDDEDDDLDVIEL